MKDGCPPPKDLVKQISAFSTHLSGTPTLQRIKDKEQGGRVRQRERWRDFSVVTLVGRRATQSKSIILHFLLFTKKKKKREVVPVSQSVISIFHNWRQVG